MSERTARGAWRIYLLIGVLVASGYFTMPSSATRDLAYDLVGNVVGLSAIAAIIVGVRVHRPVRPSPWYLFAVALLLFVLGDAVVTTFTILQLRIPFPSIADAFYLAFYPLMAVGLLMFGSSRLTRNGAASFIDPIVVTTSFGLLFWVYFMEPYIVEAYSGHPSLTPASVLTAAAYPLMDLLLLAVLVRTLLTTKGRPPAYRLLGASLGTLLISDIVWTVAQAIGSRQLSFSVDVGILLFLTLFGAAALHPSMATLFEPVPLTESRLTRPRLALLAGASLMAPAVLALQAARGEPINAPLLVTSSATLFLLVVARMAGMMRARERAADRERVLRRAGAALAASQDKEDLHETTLEAALELLGPSPVVGVSLWEGAPEDMEEAATTGDETGAHFGVQDLPEEARNRFLGQRSLRVDPSDLAFAQESLGHGPRSYEVFLVPLRARGETTGALVVASQVPFPQESQDALEALGAEVALALENLQLLEEVRQTSILKERQRLSHEIHDTLAQGFTSIVMSLSTAQLAHPEMFSDSAPAQRHLELARRIARESLAETRRLVWALRPEALDRHPLPRALEGLAEEWSVRTGVEARFDATGVPRELLPEIEVALLRIAQEALTNVQKHAGAERVMLTLSYLEELVALDVSDDGVGFVPCSSGAGVRPQDVGGFGLTSMRERIEKLGGSLSVESTPNGGTTLGAALPAPLAATRKKQPTRERKAVEEIR
ncbi:GAF domain-containing sensor histidine kinase [Rubrobacter marinus]|uniref:GAF domain-containing sensor histidine kinase n=1 Tax=Rubrobacter marinus TaxID=2653852 RepID=UPI00140CA002|nr:GAF domain-containing sensor histidine kinase [Rubrobacter marinus]